MGDEGGKHSSEVGYPSSILTASVEEPPQILMEKFCRDVPTSLCHLGMLPMWVKQRGAFLSAALLSVAFQGNLCPTSHWLSGRKLCCWFHSSCRSCVRNIEINRSSLGFLHDFYCRFINAGKAQHELCWHEEEGGEDVVAWLPILSPRKGLVSQQSPLPPQGIQFNSLCLLEGKRSFPSFAFLIPS